MSERGHDPKRLDLRRLAGEQAQIEGEMDQSSCLRLVGSVLPLADALPPAVRWVAQGMTRPVRGGEPEIWLHLRAETRVGLLCQRCLQPLNEALVVDRRFRFVTDEDEAVRLDEDSDDDVLALPARLDLFGLIEDELILALPIVPRHDSCPLPLHLGDTGAAAEAAAPAERPNPFAALAALRKRSASG